MQSKARGYALVQGRGAEMTAKLNLTPLEEARLEIIKGIEKTCADCGETKFQKQFQIRKRRVSGEMHFHPGKYCTRCENKTKTAARNARADEVAQYGPVPGSPIHEYFCRVQPRQEA